MPRAARHREDRGMTVVEVLVAATILLVGVGATFTVIGRGQALGSSAQRNEQAVIVAQAEIERVRATSYDALGLTATPTVTATSCNASSVNPNDWLRAGSPPTLLVSTSYRDCAGTTLATEQLVICGASGAPTCATATVAPGPTSVSLADGTTAKVYRYVTWRPVTACTAATSGCTTTTQGSKRVSVAVVPDARVNGGIKRPVWTSTIVTKASGT